MPIFRRKRPVEFETLEEAVAYYRALGFFAGSTLDDAALAAEIKGEHDEEWEGEIELAPGEKELDLFLMLADPDRMVDVDMEGQFFFEGEGFIELLQDLARISRGKLAVTDVREEWPDEEHVRVHFTLNGERHVLEPEINDDWLDPEFMSAFEDLAGGAASFHALDNGQAFWIVELTDDEFDQLQRERRLKFAY